LKRYDLPRPNPLNPSHTTTTRIKPKRNGRQTAHDQTAVHTNGTTNNDFERSEADGNSKNFGDTNYIEMTHEEKINYMRIATGIVGFRFNPKDLDLFVSIYELVIQNQGETDLKAICKIQAEVEARAIAELEAEQEVGNV
jgi:hypothetical protein